MLNEKGFSSTKADTLFNFINYTLLTLFLIALMYPLYFIIIASFSDPIAIYNGEVLFTIKNFTLLGYEKIFKSTALWIGYRNALFYLVSGTTFNLLLTVPAAYALSRKDLKGRNLIMGLFVFTMFFEGGLIPTYMLVNNIGLNNSIWIMIFWRGVIIFNLIVARTFFMTTIPDELVDAAKIDGCTNVNFFSHIVLPLSQAIIAVLALFYGVYHWNDYFTGLIYLQDSSKYPLQLVLQDILKRNQALQDMGLTSDSQQQLVTELLKYGSLIIASLPMLIIYPFVQRYFVKGVMIGAVKG